VFAVAFFVKESYASRFVESIFDTAMSKLISTSNADGLETNSLLTKSVI